MIQVSSRSTALGITGVFCSIAAVLVAILPFFQLVGRAIADGIITTVAIFFLIHAVVARNGRWLREGWFPLALALWAVIVLASALSHSSHSLVEALVMIRFPLFAKALEEWVLTGQKRQMSVQFSIAIAGVWIVSQCWEQYLTGSNLMGYPRWLDGALTGPFHGPRAGPALLMTFFPGLMLVPVLLFQKGGARNKLIATALAAFFALTMVLVGQRMPTLQVCLGLVLCALLIRETRLIVAAAAGTAILTVLALPVLSPPAYHKLVIHFIEQMSDFPHSDYGQIYIRALTMLHEHPVFGLGFDGYRRLCDDPTYLTSFPFLDKWVLLNNPHEGCNIHTHNFYLEIATSGGLVALFLFAALVVVWLRTLLRAYLSTRDALLGLLLVIVAVLFWPIESNSSFFTERTGGWTYLLLGLGLARAHMLTTGKRTDTSATG
ncbi:MAG: O-antigen ligase family protein [Acetobacter papayae]|uniref:O-antigen ligase family protein n=1 Tax=Acetobacter papayae TaxID=1076592 RepID=UPI0039EA2529